jgi:hypothetical protein
VNAIAHRLTATGAEISAARWWAQQMVVSVSYSVTQRSAIRTHRELFRSPHKEVPAVGQWRGDRRLERRFRHDF